MDRETGARVHTTNKQCGIYMYVHATNLKKIPIYDALPTISCRDHRNFSIHVHTVAFQAFASFETS